MFQHSAPSHRLHRAILIILLALLTLTLSITTRAAAPASDDASATVYDNGWQSSDNGGSGMGAWTLSTSGTAGHFIANCDIAVSSRCWGMYARDGGLSDAVRSFNSDMSAGEVFTMDMDNGSVQSGGTVGFGLLNNSGENLLEFYFVGGGSNYTVDDAAGDKSSGVGFTNTGLRIEITLTSSSTYYMAITNLATSSVTRFAGALKNPAGGQAIRQLRLFNANAGIGSSYDAFFNSITLASGPTAGSLVINEIDYDQLSTDDGEFVEIKNNGASAVNLDPYHLALLQGNGSDPVIRTSIDLPNVSLAAGDYYVICGDAANVPNCDLDVTPNTNLLENGAPDGVALVLAGTIVDSVSYEGNVAAPFTEDTGVDTSKEDRGTYGYDSLSRITDGNDSNNNDTDFLRVCGTPGLANVNNTSCGAYVATTGSDTNNNCGLATQPCATVSRGIARAGNSETINVAGGTYNEAPTLDGGTMNHWAGGGGSSDWTLNDLTISGGTVNAPPGTLILAGSGSDFPVLSNAGTFNAGTYTVEFRGIDDNPSNSGDNANGQVTGSAAVTFHNVNIVNSDTSSFGVDFYATQRATINGTLTLNPRTFVAHAENGGTARSDGSPTYASGATLQYRTANPENDTFNAFAEWNLGNSGPGVPHHVQIANDSWVNLGPNPGTYTVLGDLTIARGVDGNSYGGDGAGTALPPGFEQNGLNLGSPGSSTLTVQGDVSNSGTLKQNGTVNATTVNFLRITNQAGTTSKYYGLDLTASDNLGDVVVKVSGNGDTVGGSSHEELCPYVFVNPVDPPIGRCYYIDPDNASASAVSVTFYYEYTELPTYYAGFTTGDLRLWKDNGDGTWTRIDPASASTCTSGSINCSVTASLNSSQLAAGANRYVISPFNPSTTPVTLSYFKAEMVGGTLQMAWQTSTELANLGFHLYADTPAGRERLTPQPIFSQASSPTTPQEYTWQASASDRATPLTTFYLEEIDIFGQRRLHGPFSLGQAFGARITPDPIDWAAIRAASAAQEAARTAAQQSLLATQFGASTQTGVELLVSQTGLYRVTHADLLAFGLDITGLRLNRISLTHQGQPVPIYIGGGGTRWRASSYIEFYGEALDTLYTDTNVYFLGANPADARRMASDNGAIPNATPPAFYLATTTFEEDNSYGMLTPTDDPWYDVMLLAYGGAAEHTTLFDAPDYLDGAAPVSLTVDLWGQTSWPAVNPDHHLRAYVNNTLVGEVWFEGQMAQTITAELPAGLLQPANNSLRLVAPGDSGVPWDMIAFDRFTVTYPRAFVAQENRLTFSGQSAVFRVTGLTGRSVAIYRLTEAGPVRLVRARVAPDGDAYAITFRGAPTDETYLVASDAGVLTPVLRAAQAYTDITSGTADYLMIAHPDFLAGLAPLVQYHQSRGLVVKVVNVEDIYAQFSGGTFDAQAIRDYVAQAITHMGVRYILLVGGDSYDYRDFTGNASLSFIPSLYAATTIYSRFDPVDPLYTDVDGDNVPDAAIGRFPVRTAAELASAINKTLAYASKPYGGTALFAADNAEGGISFSAVSNMLIGQLTGDWTVTNAYLDLHSAAAARSTIVDTINAGVALVNFAGHSGPYSWTYDGLFNTANAAALQNSGAPTLVVQWGCWNTYYVNPAGNTLAHTFMLSGDQGAAAVLGATSLTWASSEEALSRHLMPYLTQPGRAVGEAMLQAKRDLAQSSPTMHDVLLGWTLLGDPALVVQP